MALVNESPQHHESTERPLHDRAPNRLYRALAWVGIAAGSLFIAGSVFFSGYVLGQNSGGGHHGPHAMMLRPFHRADGPMGPPPGGPMDPDDSPRSARLTPPESPTAPSPSSSPARP